MRIEDSSGNLMDFAAAFFNEKRKEADRSETISFS
jgi:hypothetical protein